VWVLHEGYVGRDGDDERVAGTVTLILDGDAVIVIDPGMVASREALLAALAEHGPGPDGPGPALRHPAEGPAGRYRVRLRLADLVNAHIDEVAVLGSAELAQFAGGVQVLVTAQQGRR
jgi:hypothetical protein